MVRRDPNLNKVLQKLKKHPNFQDGEHTEDDWIDSAHYLSDPKTFRFTFFPTTTTNVGIKAVDWRVKLVFSKVDLSAVNRSIIKTFYKKIRKSAFGNLYTALQIGPKLLAWDEGSLVIPIDISDFRNYKAVLTVDIDVLDDRVKDDVVTKVCETCCNWNVNKSNGFLTDHNQTFINDLITSLGMRKRYQEGELGKFMKKLIDAKNPEDVSFEYDRITFKNHQQLDSYCWEKLPPTGSDVYWLLKAFDRVMWTRFYAAQQEEEGLRSLNLDPEELSEAKEPLEKAMDLWEPFHSGCYFQDPTFTGSIIGNQY